MKGILAITKIVLPIITICFMYGVLKGCSSSWDGEDFMAVATYLGFAYAINLLPYLVDICD